MSFDLVPADLVLKIFHQLPLKDRVRLRGVNGQFRDASMDSIAKMKSLIVNEDLEMYSVWNQTFSSLLESCSPTLESIDASKSCSKPFLNALPEFCYPRLEHLKIRVTHQNMGQMKMLINRNQNLRSVFLHLYSQFEWPDNVVFEKMEELEIQYANFHKSTIDLSPTLRPLIGNIPNLKRLLIHTECFDCRFTLLPQEFGQLLASTPSLEELKLDLYDIGSVIDFTTVIPTWHLPKLTTLEVNLDCPEPLSILHHLPNLFPRLESFTSLTVNDINDQDIMALSQLKHLRELRLIFLDTMKAQQIVDLMTSVPSITNLTINDILVVDSTESMVDFLTSTAAIFRRRLEIELKDMNIDESESKLEDVLKEMKDSGGPATAVTFHQCPIFATILYRPLDG